MLQTTQDPANPKGYRSIPEYMCTTKIERITVSLHQHLQERGREPWGRGEQRPTLQNTSDECGSVHTAMLALRRLRQGIKSSEPASPPLSGDKSVSEYFETGMTPSSMRSCSVSRFMAVASEVHCTT